jgi:hypothetical protein
MHFLCFVTGNKRSRVDKMSMYPLEQKGNQEQCVEKRKDSAKICNTTENVFRNNIRFSRDIFMSLCILRDFKISFYMNPRVDKLFGKQKMLD